MGAVTRGGAPSSLTPGYCQAAPPGLPLARLSVGTVQRIERVVGGDPVGCLSVIVNSAEPSAPVELVER